MYKANRLLNRIAHRSEKSKDRDLTWQRTLAVSPQDKSIAQLRVKRACEVAGQLVEGVGKCVGSQAQLSNSDT